MQKKIIFTHIIIICIFIGAIFGVSFGITYPEVKYVNNYKGTICTLVNYNTTAYNYCYQICNTTIPDCDILLNQNISGLCYNSSNNYDRYITCYVNCDIYYIVNTLYQYGTYLQLIQTNCQNNQTCIDKIINSQNVTCYYDTTNPANVQIMRPRIYEWEFIIVIIVLCLLLIIYIVINLTVFKKANFED